MALEYQEQSNGPDQDRPTPRCRKVHAGQRTGVDDSCCCCDPCNYVRMTFNDLNMRDACCRCVPQVIYLVFYPDEGEECCRVTRLAMFFEETWRTREDGGLIQKVARYAGGMFGHGIEVTLGLRASYDYERVCTWEISSPYLGIREEIEVDHFNVTCLAVPEVEITGVEGPGGCMGTLRLENHRRVKVPFFRAEPQVRQSHSVELPAACGLCKQVCRWIWVRGKWRLGQERQWDFLELEWDESFSPSGDELGQWVNYEGETVRLVRTKCGCRLVMMLEGSVFDSLEISDAHGDCDCGLFEADALYDEGESFEIVVQCALCRLLCVAGPRSLDRPSGYVEFVWEKGSKNLDEGWIGRWTYTPQSGGFREEILVNQSAYTGELSLQFQFFADENFLPYDPYVLDPDHPCSCKLSLFDGVQLSPGVSIGFKLGCGPCSLWGYLCGNCRCVNETLCVFGFINNAYLPPTVVTWDDEDLCWSGNGITVCPRADDNGNCTLAVGIDGIIEFDQVSGTVCGKVMSFLATTTNPSKGYNQLYGASHMGDCATGPCHTASPCADECGQHPLVLVALLEEWNDPNTGEPGFYGSCSTEITLHYWERYIDVGTLPSIEHVCGYIGWSAPVVCEDFEGKPFTKIMMMEISPIGLDPRMVRLTCVTILRKSDGWLEDHVGIGQCHGCLGVGGDFQFDVIECDPYYAVYETTSPLTNCDTGCGETIQNCKLTVTE